MLTIASINAAVLRDKLYKLYDERELYLAVSPCGGRWWRYKFRFD